MSATCDYVCDCGAQLFLDLLAEDGMRVECGVCGKIKKIVLLPHPDEAEEAILRAAGFAVFAMKDQMPPKKIPPHLV